MVCRIKKGNYFILGSINCVKRQLRLLATLTIFTLMEINLKDMHLGGFWSTLAFSNLTLIIVKASKNRKLQCCLFPLGMHKLFQPVTSFCFMDLTEQR